SDCPPLCRPRTVRVFTDREDCAHLHPTTSVILFESSPRRGKLSCTPTQTSSDGRSTPRPRRRCRALADLILPVRKDVLPHGAEKIVVLFRAQAGKIRRKGARPPHPEARRHAADPRHLARLGPPARGPGRTGRGHRRGPARPFRL